MITMHRIPARLIGLLTCILTLLAGCSHAAGSNSPASSQAAALSVLVDSSSSTAFISSPTYANAAVKNVGAMVMDQQLGDEFRVVSFGSRTTDHATDALSETSGYRLRLPAARKHVEASLTELFDASRGSGGDGATNILFTLQNARLTCTPRSTVVILSDGIESSDEYSVASALTAGKPVHLPAPAAPFLKGCKVVFLGIGMAPRDGADPETLPDEALQRLTAGWREYFQAAGITPADMTFKSIL